MKRALAIALALILAPQASPAAPIRTLGASLFANQDALFVDSIRSLNVNTGDLQWSCVAGACSLGLDASVFKVTGTLDEVELANGSVAFISDRDGTSDTNGCTGSSLTANFTCFEVTNTATGSTAAVDKRGGRFTSTGSWGSGSSADSIALSTSASGATGLNIGFLAEDAAIWQTPAAIAGYGNFMRINGANVSGGASTNSPGALFWDGSGGNFGAAGAGWRYNGTRFRSMLFGSTFSDVCLSRSPSGVPAGDTAFTDFFCATYDGYFDVGSTSTHLFHWNIRQGAFTDGIEKTTSGAGGARTTQAGNGGGSNAAGGDYTTAAGAPTGNGRANWIAQRRLTGAASTTENAAVTGIVIPSPKTLTDNSATGLFDIALPNLTMTGGRLSFTVYLTNGTDVQVSTGDVTFSAVHKHGSATTGYTVLVAGDNPAGDGVVSCATADSCAFTKTLSTGTLTVALALTTNASEKVTMNITADTSLGSITKFEVGYTLENNSMQAVTIL